MIATQKNEQKLFGVKLVHTMIWAFFVCVIGYVLYASVFDVLDMRVVFALGLIALEGVILKLNHGSCPLTSIAAKYTERREDSFDIFLPNWLAKHNKSIFGSISLLGIALLVYRILT